MMAFRKSVPIHPDFILDEEINNETAEQVKEKLRRVKKC